MLNCKDLILFNLKKYPFMIIHLENHIANHIAKEKAEKYHAILLFDTEGLKLITSASMQVIPEDLATISTAHFIFDSDIQLASSNYKKAKREIKIGPLTIGGNTKNMVMIAGPCAVENEKQIMNAAKFVSQNNIQLFRAGCFKPRTSPYVFQGLGSKGLELLIEVKNTFGLTIVTEVKDATHVDEVIQYADIIQVGTKAMYDQAVLRKCGTTQKPILLKRGFGSSLQEFVQAAEFILSAGNPNVILCERGIRTFETKTRFTLDLCGVAYLKEFTNLPIIIDPSHAMGYRYGVPALAQAATAMEIDGLMIEIHPNPKNAWSDANQQLSFEEFSALLPKLKAISHSLSINLI